jgi:phosphotransferase system IIB component
MEMNIMSIQRNMKQIRIHTHLEKKMTAQDIWDKDRIKLEITKSEGYDVLVI